MHFALFIINDCGLQVIAMEGNTKMQMKKKEEEGLNDDESYF